MKKILYGKTTDGAKVWIVDRKALKARGLKGWGTRSGTGSHEYADKYVPHKEVWVENPLYVRNRPFTVFHELYERNLMKRGMRYKRAHALAEKAEAPLHKHPERLKAALKRVGFVAANPVGEVKGITKTNGHKVEVVVRDPTWWEKNKWKVIIGGAAVVLVGITLWRISKR